MGHRARTGKILENTYLLDCTFFGLKGLLATYVVRGQQSALIDSGTRESVDDIIQALRTLGLFPVDKIILTHEHSDHTQGAVPLVQAMGGDIPVYASRAAKPIIEDPSKITYDYGGYTIEPVPNVIPLEEGDTIDLGGTALEIMHVPGHSPGHIALYDRENRNIFLGDSIGDKIHPTIFLPSFNPPWFDKEEFYRTVAKLKKLEFDTFCLAHYGCWDGPDAENMLDDARRVFENFWNFFEANRDRLDDTSYLATSLIEKYLAEADPALAGIGSVIIGELRDGFKQYYHLR